MVDNLQTPVEGDAADPGAKKGIAGLLGTRNGRIIAGGVALVIVLAAVAAVVYIFILSPVEDDLLTRPVPPAGSVQVTGSVEATEAVPVNRRTRPLSSTFVFRDIFVPTMKATVEATAPASGSGGSGSGSGGTTSSADVDVDVPPDVLMLRSISTDNGTPMATFIWNDQVYTVAAGDQLGDTPWRVVSIEGRSVVLLYGDSRVTLTVGQGVSK